MKTAAQIDGLVSFTADQFARCPALNEPPANASFSAHAIEKIESKLLSTCIIHVYVTLTILQDRKPNTHLFAGSTKNAIR